MVDNGGMKSWWMAVLCGSLGGFFLSTVFHSAESAPQRKAESEVTAPATARVDVPAPSPLPKLEGRLGINNSLIEADIYNGNSRPIGDVIIEVTVTNAKGAQELQRKYRLQTLEGYGGGPLASTHYQESAGYYMRPGDKVSWKFVSAEWAPPKKGR